MNETYESLQEKTSKAHGLLLKLIIKHQKEIEPRLWIGAMICALADNFERSGHSFEDFKQELQDAADFYKYPKNEQENNSGE
jgi:hypothetical protein